MNTDETEQHILTIASLLIGGVSLTEVEALYVEHGFSADQIYLLITAAQLLNKARLSAKPVKPLFKRVT